MPDVSSVQWQIFRMNGGTKNQGVRRRQDRDKDVVANSGMRKIQEMDRKMRLDFGMQGNITRIGPAPAVRSTLDLEFVE